VARKLNEGKFRLHIALAQPRRQAGALVGSRVRKAGDSGVEESGGSDAVRLRGLTCGVAASERSSPQDATF